jgi:hypothetical protein
MKNKIIAELNKNEINSIKELIEILNNKSKKLKMKIEILNELLNIEKYNELIFDSNYLLQYMFGHRKLQNIYEDSEFYIDCDEELYMDNYYLITESQEFLEYFEAFLKNDKDELDCYLEYFFDEYNKFL